MRPTGIITHARMPACARERTHTRRPTLTRTPTLPCPLAALRRMRMSLRRPAASPPTSPPSSRPDTRAAACQEVGSAAAHTGGKAVNS